ncbi:hypothetical protein [Nocardia carnea]|uniref:hypothetical protein n=1 Tax=Nocardia carnea TaxID=37328 RepID=UPI002455E996|nr:hypothetical protein [Nocardia carnea]
MTIAVHRTTETDWAHWHTRCSARLLDPRHRPDPIVRYSLGEAPEQLPDVPGTWWVVDGRVFVAAKPGDRLDHEGHRIAGIEILDPLEGGPGILLRHDDRALEVVRQNGQTAIRVYEPGRTS